MRKKRNITKLNHEIPNTCSLFNNSHSVLGISKRMSDTSHLSRFELIPISFELDNM